MLHRPSLVVALSISLSLVAACGDDGGGGGTIDAPVGGIDAAIDGALPDADPSLAPLIGTWNRAPEADQSTGFPTITFRADGTTATTPTGPADGTYLVPAPGRLKLLPTGQQPIETDFVIGNPSPNPHLILTAFLPQGTVNGLVGTWKNSTISGTTPSTTTMVVRADLTGTLSFTGPSGSTDMVGTWASESTGFAFTTTSPAATYHFRPIGTQAIGYLLFVKA
ncbi:MAG: hypothetical protein IPQ07_21085 [Myxococcales bacterium]|nr:hypothetical protein [Myxococcales bacterium]